MNSGDGSARTPSTVGPPAFAELRQPLERDVARLRRFRAAFDRISAPRSGLSELADPATECCRCEGVTREDIDQAIRAGATDLRSLKVTTRLGMGPCQGRMCWPAAARHMAAAYGRSAEEMGPLSVRPPIRPIDLGLLSELSPAPGEEQAS